MRQQYLHLIMFVINHCQTFSLLSFNISSRPTVFWERKLCVVVWSDIMWGPVWSSSAPVRDLGLTFIQYIFNEMSATSTLRQYSNCNPNPYLQYIIIILYVVIVFYKFIFYADRSGATRIYTHTYGLLTFLF